MSKIARVLDPHDDMIYIKKKGIVDLKQLYADVKKWFDSHQFEFHEKSHKIKTPSPLGTEEEIEMDGFRNEDDFVRWWIHVRFDLWDATPVMIKKNGKNIEMTKCRIRITILPYMEFDYENKWEGNSLTIGLRKFYISTIIRRKSQTEGDKFEYEFHDLHDLIKRGLNMDIYGDQYAHYWK